MAMMLDVVSGPGEGLPLVYRININPLTVSRVYLARLTPNTDKLLPQ